MSCSSLKSALIYFLTLLLGSTLPVRNGTFQIYHWELNNIWYIQIRSPSTFASLGHSQPSSNKQEVFFYQKTSLKRAHTVIIGNSRKNRRNKMLSLKYQHHKIEPLVQSSRGVLMCLTTLAINSVIKDVNQRKASFLSIFTEMPRSWYLRFELLRFLALVRRGWFGSFKTDI